MTTQTPDALLNVTTVPRLGTDRHGRHDRIIHSLDGLLEPANAAAITDVATELWRACLTRFGEAVSTVDYVLGLEAGGIVPAIGVAMASGLPYKICYKIQLALPDAVQFIEPHSAHRDMYAYGITPGQRILLVDDEITTGHTLANLVRVLRDAGAEPIGAACLIEDSRHGGRDLLSVLGIPLVSLTTLNPAVV